MIPQNFINALEVWLNDEISGKMRLVGALAAQEQALVDGKSEDIMTATAVVARELEFELERSRRREAIFARLGSHWNVAADTLTLGSIAERAGASGVRLDELREELRTRVAEVLRRNRRIARLVHVHKSIVEETITALIGTHAPEGTTGALFDARM